MSVEVRVMTNVLILRWMPICRWWVVFVRQLILHHEHVDLQNNTVFDWLPIRESSMCRTHLSTANEVE